jgi:HSP20 family protein
MTDELQTQKQEVQEAEGVERTRASRVYVPHVDIFGADDGIVIFAELPGVSEDEVDITLEKNVLTITGYVSQDMPEGYELAHGEYGIGDYQRSFTLPDEIDRNAIEASMKDGLLRVFLKKAPEAQTRKITVTSG